MTNASSIITRVVESQIAEGEPLIVRETLERLLATGRSRDEALRLISAVLAEEIYEILTTQKPCNESRYTRALSSIE
ncbi:MAG: hypothetical protein U0Z53_26005 [Blastocatellia bacterium]